MATFLKGNGVLDPLGMALGQGLGAGLENVFERRDQQRFGDYIQSVITQSAFANDLQGGTQGAMLNPPSALSTKFKDLALNLQGAQLQSMLPMSPMQQAEMARLNALTGLYGAQADAIANQSPELPTESQLRAQEMMRLDRVLQQLESQGRTGTPEYEALRSRRDEAYGYQDPEDVLLSRRIAKTDALQKELNVERSRAELEQDPLRRQELQKRIELLEKQIREVSPTKEIAQMRLEVVKSLEPGTPEFSAALGIDSPKDIPAKLHPVVQQALEKVAQGENPEDIYRYVLQTNSDLLPYASKLKQILIPSSVDLFDMLLRQQFSQGKP